MERHSRHGIAARSFAMGYKIDDPKQRQNSTSSFFFKEKRL
jgi:hypothetical protein